MSNLNRVDEVVAEICRRDEQVETLAANFVRKGSNVYISANCLGEFLGYKDGASFRGCVNKAQITASQTGRTISDNFVAPDLCDPSDDVSLTPWAAFASIIEADNTKPKVAIAKSYFATLADEEIASGEARLKERSMFKRNHRELHGAAEKAGVVSGMDHAVFDDSGYRGMYSMGVREVEKFKGVPAGQKLIDCAGTTEIAANNLRMAMTKDALEKGEAKDKSAANKLHNKNGKIVRKAVIDGTGSVPEYLPLEDKSLDQLSLEKKNELRKMRPKA